MRVYQKYPAAIRSTQWPDIVRAANNGHVDAAMAIAQDHQDTHKSIKAQNVIARRIRILRVSLFALQKQSEGRIRAIFNRTAVAVRDAVASQAKSVGALSRVRKSIHVEIVNLRISLKKEMTDIIWTSILLGVKNMGDAIKPIIRQHQESFAEELEDVALIEERLSVGLTYHITGNQANGKTKAEVDLGSDKWNEILNRLYTNIVSSNSEGMTPSDRIWDLTNRMELDVKRRLISDIANGVSPNDIADQIQKYIYVNGVDPDLETGPGIYRSAFKNAMRLARTETSRAYSDATGAWAENKSWIEGIQPTLSPAHDGADECDDYAAGDPMDPADYADTFPLHPHCMCFGTYVIKDEFLTGPNETDNSDATVQTDEGD